MWDFDSIQKGVTTAAAMVAAGTGVWSLAQQFRAKTDRIKVAYGPSTPTYGLCGGLHVVSRCDHPVTIADYGFVMCSGGLCSLPTLEIDNPTDPSERSEICYRGSRILTGRNELYEEVGYCLWDGIVGVWARTTVQKRPNVSFLDEVPHWKRAWIRLKILAKINYAC